MNLNRYEILLLIVCIILGNSCSRQKTKNGDIDYINVNANIWHLEIWNNKHLVMADYDGKVSLWNVDTNKELWSHDAGSFVFDLATGDIDQDNKFETAFVTAQGELVVLDSNGKKLWSFRLKLPLYNVGIGNFTGDSNLEITCGGINRFVYVFDHDGNQIGKSKEVERLVHRIAVGNLDDDKYDEILVIENRTIANMMEIQNGSLISSWRKPLKVPDEMINWENPRGGFFAFSVEIDDLDNDGKNELLFGDTFFNKQAVMVANRNAEPLWISERLPSFRMIDGAKTEFYSTAFVRSADLFPEIDGKEVISVAGGMFRVWDNKGNLLGSRNSALGFTDIELDGNRVFLGSCPNGDKSIYSFRLDDKWKDKVGNLIFKGFIKEIKENIQKLKEQVEQYQPKSIPEKIYDLNTGFGSFPENKAKLNEYHKQIDWFKQKFPYNNLNVIRQTKVIENTPPFDNNGEPWSIGRWNVDAINGTMTIDEILEKAKWIEENQIPTYFNVGHSCMPFITLETAEKILQTAPEYCLGFQTMEDEDIERVPHYFEYFQKPLADLCVKYGNKKCITKNKGLWWMTAPSHHEVFDAMFQNGRENVSGAATEDSNSRTPEVNLMARGGLWQAGLLNHNEVSIHADLFSFNRFQQWEYPRAGHPYLRLLVAHTTMGMTQASMRIRDIVSENGNYAFSSIGEESTEIYYHLLGKGLVRSPERNDALGYSPVGIVAHKPEQKWLIDAHNGHSPEKWVDDQELHDAVFPHNGSLWGITNTPDHAFQKVVFNKERQFGYQIPATPYGLVAIVPEYTNLNDVAGVEQWWHTDGIYVWKENGPKLTEDEAAKAIQKDYESAADKLLFRQLGEPVFMQILRIEDNHYRLYLIDPGWLNPADQKVAVKIQMEGNYSVENVLSNEIYIVNDKKFQVHVPAGLFSIVDVKKEN